MSYLSVVWVFPPASVVAFRAFGNHPSVTNVISAYGLSSLDPLPGKNWLWFFSTYSPNALFMFPMPFSAASARLKSAMDTSGIVDEDS